MKVSLMKGWLTTKDAAVYCNVSLRTLRKWLADEGLRFSLIGRKILIKREWLDAFLEAHEATMIDQSLDALADQILKKVA